MKIGGFQKTSLIDYPDKVAAVVFTQGCNFRCPYCHNRDLVLSGSNSPVFDVVEILEDLQKRRRLLDGVVITGGEPALQPDLEDFAEKIKDFGLLVKLDTNGFQPTILQSMVNRRLVDYVALDVKAPLDGRYNESIGLENFDVSFILSSMKELTALGADYELRTTVVPGLHSEEDVLDLAKQIAEVAPEAKWFLQNFQSKNCLDPEFEKIKPYSREELKDTLVAVRRYVPRAQLRI